MRTPPPTDRTLTALVDGAETWGPLQWWQLELRSFRRAPTAHHALMVLAPKDAVRSERPGITAGSCLQSLAYMFLLVAPFLGAAAMLEWLPGRDSYDFPLAFAGILTLISLPVTGWSELQRHRHPRAVAKSALRSNTLLHIVPGAVTLLIGLTAGGDLLDAGAWAWIAVIAIDVAIYLAILMRGNTTAGGPQNPHDNVDQAMTEMPAEQLRDILAERNAAIDRLVERGHIDPAVGAEARATAPGRLALTLAPDAASDYYRPDRA
ncbi:hypothetical protein ACGGZK_18665 [Agromyces sp. MMS24-K17]|uniref:hypothetical protein n=1 Tax=Agromyces sp. MMS24-K17 TaxID=3372850 RepID=UPI00375518D3